MKFNILYRALLSPAEESGGSGGGAGKSAASILPKSQRLTDEFSDDESESDDSGVTSDGADFYRRYHKLDGNGSEREPTLVKSIKDKFKENKEEDSEEEDSEESSEETKQKAKKETSAKDESGDQEEETQLTEEEEIKQLIDLNVDEIKTSKGKPISKESARVIERFKRKLTSLNEALAKSPKEADPQLTEKYTKLEEEYKKLKQEQEEEFFERSPAFKQAFIEPVEKQQEKISEFFSDYDPDEDKEAVLSLNKAYHDMLQHAKSGKGEKIKFIAAASEIAEDFVKGSEAIKRMFIKEAEALYDLKVEQEAAIADKSENRKRILAAKLENERNSNVSILKKSVNGKLREFEIEKKAVLDGLQGKGKDEYVALYQGRAKQIESAAADFAITGKITPELEAVIQDGVITPALQYENRLAWAAYADINNKVAILESEKKSLESKLAKLSKEPGSEKGRYVSERKKEEPARKPGQSIIMQALRNSGDDD